ncbi:universal stress protein [Zunongwangia endophytica]|uniref:Universal stress protein n=1 Tax=Zunongwangia endophytica TaxID=1808945 RepID=A0ABV8H703_9FLAO|nr:universal stress protein [Zunongwangia endophytica]MDN3595499.1 universal stress protein [Zunongwangia endophytica]
MRTVLLPTDFSENSYNAIKYAMQLFKNSRTKFILLNTLYNADFIIYSSLYGVYKENSTKNLSRFLRRIEEDLPNKYHEFELVSTFKMLHEEIKERVAQQEIDLIVMGTEGAQDGSELIFGTNTVHAIKAAKCPLLAIPAGAAYLEPKNILFPNDLKLDFEAYNLWFLKSIIDQFKSTVHILNVSFGKDLDENQEKSKQALQEYFDENGYVFGRINRDSVMEALKEYQKQNPVEMLVMIKNKHTFIEKLLFSSLVHEVAYNVKIPFLVLPSENYKRQEF